MSTNNGNESQNRVIKAEDTLRALLGLNQFLAVITKMVERWSRARDTDNVNCKKFSLQASINTKLWTESYQWKMKACKKFKVYYLYATFG